MSKSIFGNNFDKAFTDDKSQDCDMWIDHCEVYQHEDGSREIHLVATVNNTVRCIIEPVYDKPLAEKLAWALWD